MRDDEGQISTESHPDFEQDKGKQSPTEDGDERDEAELGRVEVVQFEAREQGGTGLGDTLSRSDRFGRAVEDEACEDRNQDRQNVCEESKHE